MTFIVGRPPSDDNPLPTADAMLVAKGYAQVTVDGTAKTLAQLLTAAAKLGGVVPAGAKMVWIRPTSDIRMTSDGSVPTVSVGWPIFANEAWPEGNLAAVQLIASGSVTVNLAFYG